MLRDRFPILKQKTYLNSCSKGALSTDVRQAYAQYLGDWDEKGSPWELWVDRLTAARHAFAGLVNAAADEIAVTTSVSAAVSALASALDFSGRRNRVVVTDFDFPTTAQIWRAQEARGARVVHVPAAGHRLPRQRLDDAIDDRTLLVNLTHVCYRHGAMADIDAVVEMAHRRGAWVLLDAYQSLGTRPLDVRRLKVDFLTGGALKYLLGSSGLAYLYVKRALIPDLIPTDTGWFAQANIFAMDLHHYRPAGSARRFESGTPAVPNLYAAVAGIKLVLEVGLDRIQDHISQLTGAVIEGVMRRGFNLVTPADPAAHGALVAIRSHKVDLLVRWLERDGVIISSRDDNLRISPHFYNNLADVDRLLDCLTRHRELLV